MQLNAVVGQRLWAVTTRRSLRNGHDDRRRIHSFAPEEGMVIGEDSLDERVGRVDFPKVPHNSNARPSNKMGFLTSLLGEA